MLSTALIYANKACLWFERLTWVIQAILGVIQSKNSVTSLAKLVDLSTQHLNKKFAETKELVWILIGRDESTLILFYEGSEVKVDVVVCQVGRDCTVFEVFKDRWSKGTVELLLSFGSVSELVDCLWKHLITISTNLELIYKAGTFARLVLREFLYSYLINRELKHFRE